MRRLDGQVAVVTGGGTGIGQAVAVALASEGACLAVVGRRREPLLETEQLVRAQNEDCLALQADVTADSEVQALLAEVVERWGRVDVVVNNAGLNVPRREMACVAPEDWGLVVSTNLTGTFLVTRAALPHMRRQGSGTVVNVSSMAGYRATVLTGPAYSAAKAGVNSFTESLNLYERKHGIRASVICPGEVSTPILENRPQPPSEAARAVMLQPDDVAAAVVFAATLPQRAFVELLTLYPTTEREWRAEFV